MKLLRSAATKTGKGYISQDMRRWSISFRALNASISSRDQSAALRRVSGGSGSSASRSARPGEETEHPQQDTKHGRRDPQDGRPPHIHRIWIHHNDEGHCRVRLVRSRTLRDLITQRSGAFPIDEALSICRGIAEALKHAHRVEVYHRAVKPENILMMNGIPKLTNFDLSFHCEEGTRHTVITDPGQLRDDAYISPDLLLDQDIDESTDFFSLGVIAYELLTGKKPFTSSRHFAAHGGRLQAEALQRLTECQVPPKTIAALREMIVSDRVQRSADVDAIIDAFSPDVPIGKPPLVPTVLNAELDPGSRYDNYEIVERIGRGAHTQVYRARGFLGREVALKLFDREVPLERIEREARIAGAVKLRESPYVVTCDGRPGRCTTTASFW